MLTNQPRTLYRCIDAGGKQCSTHNSLARAVRHACQHPYIASIMLNGATVLTRPRKAPWELKA